MRALLHIAVACALLRGPAPDSLSARLDADEAVARAQVAIQITPPPALDGVVARLEALLRHTEELLKDGRTEDRIAECEKIEDEATALHDLPHAHVEPHAWAIRQVEAEVTFMCSEWQPSHSETDNLREHASALAESLAAYEEQLACQPGSVPCSSPGGELRGQVPECSCSCLAGWEGDSCALAQCPEGCDEGDCVAPGECVCHHLGVVGAACDQRLDFAWATGDWGLCPGKGRWAEHQREVGCVRSDGLEVTDEECSTRAPGPAPPRIQDCCDAFARSELPYQQCGDADDGCGGTVSFGSCAGLGENVSAASPYYTVVSALRRLLSATTAELHHGSEQRAAACEMMHGQYSQTDTEEHFAATHTATADEWAIGQVDTELRWLCKSGREPFAEGEVQQHLDGLREVYDTYLERISCQPGDAPCVNGVLSGHRPQCMCTCEEDYTGADCGTIEEVPVTCACTGTGNEYSCTDDTRAHCASDEECYNRSPFAYGSWPDGCRKRPVTCACTGNGNEYECSDGSKAYCASNEDCFNRSPFPHGSWGEGCRPKRR